jgi:hypothetical protein
LTLANAQIRVSPTVDSLLDVLYLFLRRPTASIDPSPAMTTISQRHGRLTHLATS